MAERRITTSDVNNNLDDVVNRVFDSSDTFIVTTDGEARAAVIDLELYRALVEERRVRRAAEAKQRYIALAAEIGDRNADLSEDDIAELANEFSAEFARDMVNEGKIRFRPAK